MTDWCLANLAYYSCGAKGGVARIRNYDGIVCTIRSWDNLTAPYHRSCKRPLRPIYAWLHNAKRIAVAGAKYQPDIEAPLVLVDRQVFINNLHALSVEEPLATRLARLRTVIPVPQAKERQQ
jgi:hypothetical protein